MTLDNEPAERNKPSQGFCTLIDFRIEKTTSIGHLTNHLLNLMATVSRSEYLATSTSVGGEASASAPTDSSTRSGGVHLAELTPVSKVSLVPKSS